MSQQQLAEGTPQIVVKRSPKLERWGNFYKKIVRSKMAVFGGSIILVYIFIAIFAPLIAPYDPLKIDLLHKLQSPSVHHVMGTDDKGRDIFSRVLYGTRLSLGVGIVSVSIGAFFGITLGLISGYYGIGYTLYGNNDYAISLISVIVVGFFLSTLLIRKLTDTEYFN